MSVLVAKCLGRIHLHVVVLLASLFAPLSLQCIGDMHISSFAVLTSSLRRPLPSFKFTKQVEFGK